MIIDSATIRMESTRSYQSNTVVLRRFVSAKEAEKLRILEESEKRKEEDGEGETATDAKKESALADQSAKMLEEWRRRARFADKSIRLKREEDDTRESIRQITLRYIFRLLFGKDKDFEERFDFVLNPVGNNSTANSQNYVQETYVTETEITTFETMGTVRTADGRDISFQVNIAMSRSFQEYTRECMEVQPINMCDPLVINLDTDAAEFSDMTFYFDIDADGTEDKISQLKSGSGYLTLDKNEDGIINDGNELFGPKSGNGFADLAAYDEDGNGWIDEADSIWDKLKIWCKDANGKDILYRLEEKGVGAICLMNSATDFKLQSVRTQGIIRYTGMFLYEDGGVGTLQHVDVAKV